MSLTNAGVYPASLQAALKEKTPKFWAWAEAVAKHPAVTSIYNEDKIIETTKTRLANARGKA